jgi:hypothetical protein
MAQQTINVGAAPNDGTGTPLRTAFQYTNSNFTELYTAVGPSGNNIVVPGTATITGNLTALGNVNLPANVSLKAGPSAAVQAGLKFDASNNTYLDSDIGLIFRTGAATSFTTAYQIGATGISTWSVGGSTAMTLNSTGLGVGGSPQTRFHVIDSSGVCALFTKAAAPTAALSAVYIQAPVSSGFSSIPVLNFWYQNTGISNPASECFAIRTSSADRMYFDAVGNVISNVTGTAPTLAANSQMVFNLTSNTNLRISVRGTDGTTRVANITLA